MLTTHPEGHRGSGRAARRGTAPLRRLLLVLCLALGVLASPPAEAARKKLTVQDQYELGLRYLKRGYYAKALETFNRIRNYHRDDPLSVKAELAIADVYFKKREWDQARLAYEDFMRMHPRHPDLDYVTYRIGLALYNKAPQVAARDQTWTRQAVNTWRGFEARFPDSSYRAEAVDKLTECRERLARKELIIGRFYERRESWPAVEARVRGLLSVYPESTYAPEALHLLAQARAWQGDSDGATEVVARLREVDPALAGRTERMVERVPEDVTRGTR